MHQKQSCLFLEMKISNLFTVNKIFTFEGSTGYLQKNLIFHQQFWHVLLPQSHPNSFFTMLDVSWDRLRSWRTVALSLYLFHTSPFLLPFELQLVSDTLLHNPYNYNLSQSFVVRVTHLLFDDTVTLALCVFLSRHYLLSFVLQLVSDVLRHNHL